MGIFSLAANQSAFAARKASFAARKNELGFVGALKSEGGAIDLASIMVGVIVIGVIATVIAATVFAVIPWAQDKAASQSLDAINQAQNASYGFAAEDGAGVYNTEAGLVSETLLAENVSTVEIATYDGGKGYVAVSVSSTGNIFAIDSKRPTSVEEYATAALASAGLSSASGEGITVTFDADSKVPTIVVAP